MSRNNIEELFFPVLNRMIILYLELLTGFYIFLKSSRKTSDYYMVVFFLGIYKDLKFGNLRTQILLVVFSIIRHANWAECAIEASKEMSTLSILTRTLNNLYCQTWMDAYRMNPLLTLHKMPEMKLKAILIKWVGHQKCLFWTVSSKWSLVAEVTKTSHLFTAV